MNNPVITASNISKRYRIGVQHRSDTLAGQLKGLLTYPLRNLRNIARLNTFQEGVDDPTVFWALQDINFEVQEGEVLGIIGHNGAGKSTLLKILSRITEPSTGEINIRGRVSSLLEVGTGFHQELTGRDNVYMNGTILGMTKKEIDRKFDEILDFSGVEKHIDTPVKFYSSGMKVRLAFSVASYLDPEILIIDEVLAVGDLAFQQKCLGRMNEVSDSGRTVLFVSHNMGPIEGLCDRVMMLERGRIVFNGDVAEGVDRYKTEMYDAVPDVDLEDRTDRKGAGNFRFMKVVTNEGQPVMVNRPLKVALHYRSTKDISNLNISFKFIRNRKDVIATVESKSQGALIDIKEREGVLTIEIPNLPLMPGTYMIGLWAGAYGGTEDSILNVMELSVEERDVYETGNLPNPKVHGVVVLPKSRWYQDSYVREE